MSFKIINDIILYKLLDPNDKVRTYNCEIDSFHFNELLSLIPFFLRTVFREEPGPDCGN